MRRMQKQNNFLLVPNFHLFIKTAVIKDVTVLGIWNNLQ